MTSTYRNKREERLLKRQLKLGYVKKCIRCGKADDRKHEDHLCKQCFAENREFNEKMKYLDKKTIEDNKRKADSIQVKRAKYKNRLGAWA